MKKYLIIVCLFIFSSCTKQPFFSEGEIQDLISKKGSYTPNLLPGPCPYECFDPRCVVYSEPSIDCDVIIDIDGGERICNQDFAQFNLQGSTFAAAVDSLGKWHNDYQIFILQNLKASNVDLLTDTIQSFLHNKTVVFMATKGVTPQNTILPEMDLLDTSWNISNFSFSAQMILTDLKNLMDNYSVSNHFVFRNNCLTLKNTALNLPDTSEAITVGLTVSVAINSFTYWKDNSDDWENYLTVSQTLNGQTMQSVNVDLKRVGKSDIKGAITGAVSGLGGGVAGAFAGGLVGSGLYSAGNILYQVLESQPGVVGQVSRFISDWFF